MVRLPPTSISEHFATLTDPRVERGKEHLLVDILMMRPTCHAVVHRTPMRRRSLQLT